MTTGPAAHDAAISRVSCSLAGHTSLSWHSEGGNHCIQSTGGGPGSLQRGQLK